MPGRYISPSTWAKFLGSRRAVAYFAMAVAGLGLFAGCGIVADSIPADELAEADAKLIPIRSALGG